MYPDPINHINNHKETLLSIRISWIPTITSIQDIRTFQVNYNGNSSQVNQIYLFISQ